MAKKTQKTDGQHRPQPIQLDIFSDYVSSPSNEETANSVSNEFKCETYDKKPSIYSENPSRGRKIAQKDRTRIEEEEWNTFKKHACASKAQQGEREQVWIDDKLKRKLEKMRTTSLRLPIIHILNGIITSFLEAHSDRIKKLMEEDE